MRITEIRKALSDGEQIFLVWNTQDKTISFGGYSDGGYSDELEHMRLVFPELQTKALGLDFVKCLLNRIADKEVS